MLKLFKFSQGQLDYYGAFKDEKEAYDRRADVDPTFHYTHVEINELTIPGHTIMVLEDDDLPFADLEFTVTAPEIPAEKPAAKAKPRKRNDQ